MPKRKVREDVDMWRALVTMVKANIMAYSVTIIFILFTSIILTYTNASAKMENWLMTIGIILASFLAGFDTATVDNRNGYKWGAIGGALYFVIFLILGIILNKLSSIAPGTVCLIAVLVMLSSTIAGMISVNCQK